MARLWHTLLLYKWRNIFEYIPLESQIERFQTEYYEASGAKIKRNIAQKLPESCNGIRIGQNDDSR